MTSAQDRPSRPSRRRRARRPGAEPASRTSPASQDGPASQARGAGPVRSAPTGSEPDSAGRRSGDPSTGRREDSGRGHGRESERGWRELAGSSPSQVGLGGALRARDVARPTAADLAAAERAVVVVRRQWQPPEA
ncbi:MAG: hypothetical protein ABI047_16930 [Jatrophihabitantaceae bacterium]